MNEKRTGLTADQKASEIFETMEGSSKEKESIVGRQKISIWPMDQ